MKIDFYTTDWCGDCVRSKALLKKLNVDFLPMNLNVNSKAFDNILPITISGTIAIERSLKGLKTIVAGNPWYIKMPGIIKFNSLVCSST